MLLGGYEPEVINDIRWVKIFTWEGNGDGINPFKEAFKYLCILVVLF